MKILYILIFSVLFFNPSHCQNEMNGKDEEGKEVYSATSDDDDSGGSLLYHPRNTRGLLLSEKLDSLRDKRILPKNKLTDFLHAMSEFISFLYLFILFYNSLLLLLSVGSVDCRLCFFVVVEEEKMCQETEVQEN